jgi:hypothetical protein
MIDGCDGRVQIVSEGHRKAKKEHRCHECGRSIPAGEMYLYEAFIYNGDFETHKTCQHCEAVRQWLNDECGGWLYGGVAEDIHEHAEDNHYGMRVKMMSVGLHRQWRRMDGRMWPVPRMPKLSVPPSSPAH